MSDREIARLEARARDLRQGLHALPLRKLPAFEEQRLRLRLASKLARVEYRAFNLKQGRLAL